MPNTARVTGEQAARRVIDSQGLYDVAVEAIPGELTDHYYDAAVWTYIAGFAARLRGRLDPVSVPIPRRTGHEVPD